jgi:hypothetical protein
MRQDPEKPYFLSFIFLPKIIIQNAQDICFVQHLALISMHSKKNNISCSFSEQRLSMRRKYSGNAVYSKWKDDFCVFLKNIVSASFSFITFRRDRFISSFCFLQPHYSFCCCTHPFSSFNLLVLWVVFVHLTMFSWLRYMISMSRHIKLVRKMAFCFWHLGRLALARSLSLNANFAIQPIA